VSTTCPDSQQVSPKLRAVFVPKKFEGILICPKADVIHDMYITIRLCLVRGKLRRVERENVKEMGLMFSLFGRIERKRKKGGVEF
jgi:hypothetical protein